MRSPLAIALLFLTTSAGGVIIVPGDQPDLESAIAVASAGDTILVQTPDNQNSFPSVVIDKPLEIVGDPVCRIDLGGGSGLLLAGPGSGEVVLRNVTMQYPFADANGRRALHGDGFRSLRMVDCTIRHDNFAGSGLIESSYPAVDLPSIKRITAVRCDLLGGPAGADDCVAPSPYTNGSAGIYAPQASVVLMRSTVRGGRGGFIESSFVSCPDDLSWWNGKGGDGVVAKNVHSVASDIRGGSGARWFSYLSGVCNSGPSIECGKQVDGDPYVVSGSLVIPFGLAPPRVGLPFPLGR